MSPKGPPTFLIFCNRLDFQKVEGLPPLINFENCAFLSLRYSADFRRSLLVAHTFCRDVGETIGGNERTKGSIWQVENDIIMESVLYPPRYSTGKL